MLLLPPHPEEIELLEVRRRVGLPALAETAGETGMEYEPVDALHFGHCRDVRARCEKGGKPRHRACNRPLFPCLPSQPFTPRCTFTSILPSGAPHHTSLPVLFICTLLPSSSISLSHAFHRV